MVALVVVKVLALFIFFTLILGVIYFSPTKKNKFIPFSEQLTKTAKFSGDFNVQITGSYLVKIIGGGGSSHLKNPAEGRFFLNGRQLKIKMDSPEWISSRGKVFLVGEVELEKGLNNISIQPVDFDDTSKDIFMLEIELNPDLHLKDYIQSSIILFILVISLLAVIMRAVLIFFRWRYIQFRNLRAKL